MAFALGTARMSMAGMVQAKFHDVLNGGCVEVEPSKVEDARAQASAPRFYSSLRHFDQ